MAARDDDEDSGDATKNDVLLPCHDPWHRRFKSTKRTGSTVLGMLMLSKTEPEWRDYQHLVRVLIRCAHCGMPLWAQTFTNGRSYYREHRGSRGIEAAARHLPLEQLALSPAMRLCLQLPRQPAHRRRTMAQAGARSERGRSGLVLANRVHRVDGLESRSPLQIALAIFAGGFRNGR